MQEETTNPLEGLCEEDLQRITGGCGNCTEDQSILENAHNMIQAYRSGNRQAIPLGQFHAVRMQGTQASINIARRHGGNMPEIDRSRANDLYHPHPEDPPRGWRAFVVDPKALSGFEK